MDAIVRREKRHVRLTDAQLRTIADAPADVSAREIANAIGALYKTVCEARRRIARDGWVCPIAWATCAVCGLALARGAHHQTTVHAHCRPARAAQRARAYRAEGRPWARSTRYVTDWRRRHPERAAELNKVGLIRMRERWPDLPAAEQAAQLARAHLADQRDYHLTLELAEQSGAAWTEEEDAEVWRRLREPARDVALDLGRTLWAIRGRRVILRRRQRRTESGSSAQGYGDHLSMQVGARNRKRDGAG